MPWHDVKDDLLRIELDALNERIADSSADLVEALTRIAVALEHKRDKPAFPSPEEVCGRDESRSWDSSFRTILESGWSERQRREGKDWSVSGMPIEVATKVVERLVACGWEASYRSGSDGPNGSFVMFRVRPKPTSPPA